MPDSSNRRLCLAVLLLAILAMFSGAPRACAQAGEPPYFAIKGATVVPVSGPRIENATVVISRGLITAVGANVAIPEEAWVIDGKGLTVYPGLFDSFTDIGIVAAPPAAQGAPRQGPPQPQAEPPARGPEDRPVSTPWRSAADEVTLADKRIESWRNGGFTTVVSAPEGGFFPGQGALLDLAGDLPGDMVVKPTVVLPISLTTARGFGGGFPSSLMGSLAYVHQVWLDTEWSTKAGATYAKNPRSTARPRFDRTENALDEILEDRTLVLIPANNEIQIRRSFELADRWHVNAALYGAQMAYELPSEIAVKKLPVLVDLKWPEPAKDADPDQVPSLRTLQFRDRAPSSPAALAKAGARFAFYSGGITTPKDILKAVKKSIDAGLSPDAALRALTLSPAEIFGVSDRLGSIENGKIANLVITDGDLFNDKTKIKYVFVDGHEFPAHEPEKPKDPPKGDLTGKWKLSYTADQGAEESTADIAMAADGSLSGSATSPHGTATIVSGYLSGDKFTFTVRVNLGGTPTDVVFSGTYDGTSMKGSFTVQGTSIDFTGTKPGFAAANSDSASSGLGGAQ